MSAKFNPDELLSVLIEIARSGARSHISQEYRRCVGSSAGLTEETLFPRPTQTPATPSPSGGAPSVLHIEDTWWKQQDADPNYTNQWDHDDTYDNTDPKSWK